MNVLIANPAFRRDMGNGLERFLLGSGMRFPFSMLKEPGRRPRYVVFPMFLGYTAAVLEQSGFHVKALDGVPLNLTEADFVKRAVEAAPDVIVFEPSSSVISDVLALAETLKARMDVMIVLAGTHVTSEYRDILQRHVSVDYIVRGEFEYGVRDLMCALRDGTTLDRVPGLVFRESDGQAPVKVGIATKIDDMNALPMPARHLFPAWFNNDMGLYHDGFCQGAPTLDVHATRGCPYSCNFCAWVHVLYEDGPQRLRNPIAVVDEMEHLVTQYGAREIYFDDDNFSANRKFVKALCAELKRRGNPVAWSAMTDAIALNHGLLETMAEAGCVGIKFGLDSADAQVLQSTSKPLKVSRVADIVHKARRLGIKTHMTVVLGLVGETRASLNHTFNFACQLDIDSVQISIATPLPGTPLYRDLKRQNRLDLTRWDELDGYSSTVIRYDDFSRQDLEQFIADAHSRWLHARLRNPRWVLRQLWYLKRLAALGGIKGLRRRFERFIRIVGGDSTECRGDEALAEHKASQPVNENAHTPTVRW